MVLLLMSINCWMWLWLLLVSTAWSFHCYIPTPPATLQRRRTTGTLPCRHHNVHIHPERSISDISDPKSIHTINDTKITRRNVVRNGVVSAFWIHLIGNSFNILLLGRPQIGYAADHRQLELCLVAVLRVLYWAQYEVQQMDDVLMMMTTSDPNHNIDRQRAIYLETRLGAKAALTGRITGSGATNRVYILTTLQLPGCLQDLEWYLNASARGTNVRNRMDDVGTSFREGIASIVEFDGLDSLTDPSPRSALTMSQYNIDKLKLVRRILKERVIPDGQKLVVAFGPEAYQRSYGYVQQYYSTEIPIRSPVSSSE